VTDDRGQALILAVLALAIAAVTIVGLETAQDRILADALVHAGGPTELAPLPDALEQEAHAVSAERARSRGGRS